MYTIVYVRDFPHMLIGWTHSYLQHVTKDLNEVIIIAQTEVNSRGGKYGAVIYQDGKEVHKITKTV